MIQHLSLKHGWFYHYRVHTEKMRQLCGIHPGLQDYLQKMLKKGGCPDEPFTLGPRSSALRFPIAAEIKEVEHPVIELAAAGLDWGAYNTAHSNVQVFMLQHDKQTLAVEVPIWMHNLGEHATNFDEVGPLSGHIDVLRKEDDGKLWVWDYKPNAHREKWAATQVYFYAQMLARRTGIPLSEFRCGWFDDKKAYVFSPEKVK